MRIFADAERLGPFRLHALEPERWGTRRWHHHLQGICLIVLPTYNRRDKCCRRDSRQISVNTVTWTTIAIKIPWLQPIYFKSCAVFTTKLMGVEGHVPAACLTRWQFKQTRTSHAMSKFNQLIVISTGPSCVLFTVLKKLGFVILAELPPLGAEVLSEPLNGNVTEFRKTQSRNLGRNSTCFLPSRSSYQCSITTGLIRAQSPLAKRSAFKLPFNPIHSSPCWSQSLKIWWFFELLQSDFLLDTPSGTHHMPSSPPTMTRD